MNMIGTANLILRISEYGMKQERFTLIQVREALKLDEIQFNYLLSKLTSTRNHVNDNPNQILGFVNRPASNHHSDVKEDEYSLLPNAMFNYVDWIEVIEAKKYAQDAKRLSILAVILTAATIVVSLVIGIMDINTDRSYSKYETIVRNLSQKTSKLDSTLKLKDQKMQILIQRIDSLKQTLPVKKASAASKK